LFWRSPLERCTYTRETFLFAIRFCKKRAKC